MANVLASMQSATSATDEDRMARCEAVMYSAYWSLGSAGVDSAQYDPLTSMLGYCLYYLSVLQTNTDR